MSEYIRKRWEEERASLLKQLQAINDDAQAAKRDISAEEMEQVRRISSDMDGLRDQIKNLNEIEAANRSLEEAVRSAGIKPQTADAPADDAAAKFRSFVAGEGARTMEIAPEKRALSIGTNTAGGYTVPTNLYDQIVQHMVLTSGVLKLKPTVWNTANGDPFTVPTTTSHGGAALTTEGSSLNVSDPAFTLRTLGAYKFSQIVTLSSELLEDTQVDLTGYLAQAVGRNLGLALAPYLVTGTGSSQPAGIVTGASSGVTGSTGVTGAFSYANLVNLFHSVIQPYRDTEGAGWLMKDSSLAAVRLLQDGAGRYIFEPGQAGQPDMILNKPVQTDPNVAATGVNNKSVVFGDISTFWVRYAGNIRFERSVDRYFDTDQVAFRAILRADSILVDQTGAVKYFVGAAT